MILGNDGIVAESAVVDAAPPLIDAQPSTDATPPALGVWEPTTISTGASPISKLAITTRTGGFELLAQIGTSLQSFELTTDLAATASEMTSTSLIDLTRPLRNARALTQVADGSLRLGGQAFTAPAQVTTETIELAPIANTIQLIGRTTGGIFTLFNCTPDCTSVGDNIQTGTSLDLDTIGPTTVAAVSEVRNGNRNVEILAQRDAARAFCILGLGENAQVAGSGNLGLMAWDDDNANAMRFTRLDTAVVTNNLCSSVGVTIEQSSAPVALVEAALGDFVSAFRVGGTVRVVRVTVPATLGVAPMVKTLVDININGAPDHIAVTVTEDSEPTLVVAWSVGNALQAARGPIARNP